MSGKNGKAKPTDVGDEARELELDLQAKLEAELQETNVKSLQQELAIYRAAASREAKLANAYTHPFMANWALSTAVHFELDGIPIVAQVIHSGRMTITKSNHDTGNGPHTTLATDAKGTYSACLPLVGQVRGDCEFHNFELRDLYGNKVNNYLTLAIPIQGGWIEAKVYASAWVPTDGREIKVEVFCTPWATVDGKEKSLSDLTVE